MTSECVSKQMRQYLSKHSPKVTEAELYSAYKLFFNTFGSRSRLKILNLLRSGLLTVGKITQKLGEEQSRVSHNLKRLKACGFVQSEVKGKYRLYSLKKETILPLLNLIDLHMSRHCLIIIQEKRRKNSP